ncbi:aspartate aminotransferase family protein [Pseudomonas sp. ABFPK]|uniref:aspartate aminotransferase family protein n=1 Tax=Pseudomonas sp. ABFPK TaxID=1636605 RepID=UPI000778E76E|nr:aminotransferase class III-fold pyridoxal phosphate-dependent enzyme [Pseudomonas sp. ABFPK]KYC17786.1 glutamate-1-semialdehyde aminotransferase [Pseudomonas sp. ABFPK]
MFNLVGDVSSAARILPDLNGEALFISHAKGAYLWDDKGRKYIDTALGFGAVLVGHADDDINSEVAQALGGSASPSWAHIREHGAASALAAHTGNLTKVVFNNSGSEAVHLACRIARTYTGKGKIAKMAAGFDGWLDDVAFGNVSTQEAAFKDGERPSTPRTTLLRFNDFDDVERLFQEDKDIAAVILEPMLANAGCIMASPGYLQHVQNVARKHGALVISDEVLMGFRRHAGLASHLEGLDPDLASVGKAIGNGIPVSAVVGKAEVMAVVEAGRAARGGTFSGNPMACAAVTSTLAKLDAADYEALTARGDKLRESIIDTFKGAGITVTTSGYGNVFGIWLGDKEPRNYEEAAKLANPAFTKSLHLALREAGLMIMPSPYGRLYISFEHSPEVIEEMKAAFKYAAAKLAGDYAK